MRVALRVHIVRAVVRVILVVVACVSIGVVLVRQPVFGGIPQLARDRADANVLRAHVELLTSLPRDAAHPEGLDRAADYIAGHFRASGARVEEQRYRARGRMYRNVIARFGAGDATPLVVGAHYDAFSLREPLPGADDNASGTAGLLELARILGRNAPRVPVTLVAYSTEEPPFFGSEQMGSAVHAESERAAGAMICLEMIGYFRGEQRYDSWVLELLYPKRGDFIAIAGGWRDRELARAVKRGMRAAGMRALSFTGPRETLDASDQRNYWARGWTAVMITDTAYLRNPHYHTARDTAATLDYAAMARVIDGVAAAVLSGVR